MVFEGLLLCLIEIGKVVHWDIQVLRILMYVTIITNAISVGYRFYRLDLLYSCPGCNYIIVSESQSTDPDRATEGIIFDGFFDCLHAIISPGNRINKL